MYVTYLGNEFPAILEKEVKGDLHLDDVEYNLLFSLVSLPNISKLYFT
jgi:hypothetical protein